MSAPTTESSPPSTWNHPEYQDAAASSSESTSPSNRKRRWTRAERRERADERKKFQTSSEATVPMQSSPQRQKRSLTTERRVINFADQLLACAEKARHTEAVVVIPATQSRDYDRYQPTAERNVRVVTNCDLPYHDNDRSQHYSDRPRDGHNKQPRHNHHTPFDHTMSPTTTTTIHIKPLLVLDLNGILCHRIRAHRELPASQRPFPYRPPAGNIASTPVIPRTDVADFLAFLQQHFTLAVWTSAQRKTAVQLVQLLFPPYIQERLLFVWAQGQCDRVLPPTSTHTASSTYSYYQSPSLQQQPDPSQVLYVKDLSKVWKEFPLWNASNTLLMDDSPDKCPFRQNALHPPPIHGQERQGVGHHLPPPPQPSYQQDHYQQQQHQPQNHYQHQSDGHYYNETGNGRGDPYHHPDSHQDQDLPVPDEENQARQLHFFEQLVYYWRTYPNAQVFWEQDPNLSPDPTRQHNDSLLRFLDDYATGHMGWMVSIPNNNDSLNR